MLDVNYVYREYLPESCGWSCVPDSRKQAWAWLQVSHRLCWYHWVSWGCIICLLCSFVYFCIHINDGISANKVFRGFRVIRQTQGWEQLQRSGGLRSPQYPGLSNPQIFVILILSLQWTGRTMVLSQTLLFVFQYLCNFIVVCCLMHWSISVLNNMQKIYWTRLRDGDARSPSPRMHPIRLVCRLLISICLVQSWPARIYPICICHFNFLDMPFITETTRQEWAMWNDVDTKLNIYFTFFAYVLLSADGIV